MFFTPLHVLLTWLLGLLSFALIGGGVYLVWSWVSGAMIGAAPLLWGLGMLLWAFAGRFLIVRLRRPGADEPKAMRTGAVQRLARPDGTELEVEMYGPAEGPPLVLTHGWGGDSTTWYYAKRQLADHARLILWDVRGLGKSSRSGDGLYNLEKMAEDLLSVVALAGGRPVILVGHSMGGMILLTFCRMFPQHLGREIAGLVLVNTTPTNPAKTTLASGFSCAIQKPLVEPLLHLTIWLSPVVWLMNLSSYLNGSTHILTALTSFAGRETRGQLEFSAQFSPRVSPSVMAKQLLAMLHWDATQTLASINVPVLIVAGDKDLVTKPDASIHMSEKIPGAELVTITPAGHLGILEQNTKYFKAIEDFSQACLRST